MKKSSRILLFSAGAAGLIFLLPLAYLALSVRHSQRALREYLTTLEKQGETFDVAMLAPTQPSSADNGGPDFLAAAKSLKDMPLRDDAYRIRITSEQAPGLNMVLQRADSASVGKQSVPWDAARKKFQPLALELARSRDASRKPIFEVQPDYTKGMYMDIAALSESLTVAKLLAQQGLLFLQEGDPAAAAENALSVLRLAGMLEKQHALLSRLVTLSVLDIAYNQTWEILQSPLVSPDTLTALQNAWGGIDVLSSFPALLRTERAGLLPYFQAPRFEPFFASLQLRSWVGPSSAFPVYGGVLESLPVYVKYYLWSQLCRYSDAKKFAESYQTLIKNVPPPYAPWGPLVTRGKLLEADLSGSGFRYYYAKLQAESVNNAIVRAVGSQTLARLTITAIALQRYKLTNGGYPATLAELVPGFLPSIPQDPFDCSLLHYERQADGNFLLYANGRDGLDGRGDPTHSEKSRFSILQGNDIVWPRPAP